MSRRNLPRLALPAVWAVFVAAVLVAAGSAAPARAEEGVGEEPRLFALDTFFKGTVELEGGVVTVRYDFRDAAQLADWEPVGPFKIYGASKDEPRWFDGHLEIPAKTSMTQRAVWTGDVTISATVRFDQYSDLGAFLAPSDGAHDYAIFTLNETYFHKWDNSSGGLHSIIQFGDQWREGNADSEFVGFRYVTRKPGREQPQVGEAVSFEGEWVKGRFGMRGPDKLALKGKVLGKPLGNVVAGLYTAVSRMRVDEAFIRGRLDPTWMSAQGLQLALSPNSMGLDAATTAQVAAWKAGDRAACQALVGKLRDPGLPAAERTALEGVLSSGAGLPSGPTTTLHAAVELLYDGAVEARRSGLVIIKAYLGKDFGYKPEASEEKRKPALDKILAAIRK